MTAHAREGELLDTMSFAIETAAPWVLPKDAPHLRVPTRPLKYRQAGFEQDYDSTTVFYDCVWVEEGRRAVLLGPPMLNLKKYLAGMRIVARPSGHTCTFHLKTLDRHSQCWVDTPPGTASLELRSELGSFSIRPSWGSGSVFEGKRVLLTLNKNNRIEWICDWVRYHRDIHGADAVLLYDNGSTDYALARLEEELRALKDIAAIRIVQWDFKYGPQSWHGKYWDSDYCQLGHFEHARWRFLQSARAVMNVDIDELVLSNGRNIFEAVETSPRQYVSYFGRWIVAPSGMEGQPRSGADEGASVRHKEFSYALAFNRKWKQYRFVQENRCPPKWSVVPASCPAGAQWKPHRIAGMSADALRPDQTGYRHFREVNTNWKYKRSSRDAYDPARHHVDHDLVACMQRVRWDI